MTDTTKDVRKQEMQQSEDTAKSACNGLLDEALRNTGFELCLFAPDEYPCEKCGTTNLQLYFQGPEDAGRYYCADCIIAENKINIEQDGI